MARFRITQTRTTVEKFIHNVDAPTREEAENMIVVASDADDNEIVSETFAYTVENPEEEE